MKISKKIIRNFATHQIRNIQEFDKFVLQNTKPVILDFWADWCPPCKKLKPVIESMESQHYDVALLNVDDVENVPQEYEVSGIPCVLLMKNGQEVDRFVGFKMRADIESWLQQNGVSNTD